MAKHERTKDGMYSKLIISAIVVIWVALVGGNWLGHYVVEKGMLGTSGQQEYRSSVQAKPKPWITVDPSQQQELERLQGTTEARPVPTSTPRPAASANPEEVPEEPAITASPVLTPEDTPAPAVTPVMSTATPTSADPVPTPALSEGNFHLQFGSFTSRENAQSMVDSLAAVGQAAEVEEIQASTGKTIFRVRGGVYSEEQARQQRDKLREQNIQAFIVNSQ
jgi:cell division protein FtsN